jgi:hypothetical protein
MSIINPERQGWYWFYFEGRPFEPQLYKLSIHKTKPSEKPQMHCSRRGRQTTPNTWEYYKNQDEISAIEYIGEHLPDLVMPKESGFHWVTARNGTRDIVRVIHAYKNLLDGAEIKALCIGRQYQYDWEQVIESFQAVRIDFIAPADGFIPQMRD